MANFITCININISQGIHKAVIKTVADKKASVVWTDNIYVT